MTSKTVKSDCNSRLEKENCPSQVMKMMKSLSFGEEKENVGWCL